MNLKEYNALTEQRNASLTLVAALSCIGLGIMIGMFIGLLIFYYHR